VLYVKTTQTPATAKSEKYLRMRFFTNFWPRLLRRIRKKNAGSCRNRLPHSGSLATFGIDQLCPTEIAYWVKNYAAIFTRAANWMTY